MGDFPTKIPQTSPYIIVAALSIVAFLFGNNAIEIGEFNRQAIYENEMWRLISAHFLHTNFFHMALNLVGVLLLWMLHGDYTKPLNFAVLFLILSLSVSFGVLLFSTHLNFYVGLSGVLHGIFAWGVMHDIRQNRRSGYILLLGLIIKLIDEQFFSDDSFMNNLIDATVAVDAHLYGAIVGIVLSFVIPARKLVNAKIK